MQNFQTIFRAGSYEPQGTFTNQDVLDIANSYDPENAHEAPLWIGHPNFFSGEPKALAWVKSLRAVGDELHAEFADATPELKQMISSKEFKRCSVELGKIKKEDGAGGFKESWYLFAVGLTNRPAVGGLKPLSFSSDNTHKFSPDRFKGEYIVFESTEIQTFFSPNHKSIFMFAKIISTAAKFGLNVTGATEATVDNLLSEMEAKFSAVSTELSTSKTELATLKSEKEAFSKTRATDLLDATIAAGKMKPADKSKFEAFALSNYDDAKVMFAAMPVDPALQKDVTTSAAATGADEKVKDAKFKNADGTPLTYSQFLEFCKKDVKFADTFTAEEISELKTKEAK